ncbi:SDR family oxidoreductase [Mucilaginibacter sp. ZT4R22]|uniref:SDR family oxidoreductase n=1 Tax=Mucilaginibacter pankratovii TaxID=2772110 RepID=A0ABR7WX82_9SPHI|nr:SDR family oxidoreductase [Mucilaginibacter pankratovii]MBD1366910.1 SDR family oxidoreductase [Mucilaginibacter pankratovii]
MNFNNKNILVVGGSSGIGLAIIKQLSAKGATVYNASRSVSAEWPNGVNHIPLDVLDDASQLAGLLPEQLHGLVYSVGSINLKPFNRLSKDDFLNDYRLNVLGAAAVIQQSLKALKNAGEASVVLFSTVAATVGMGFHASIASAKGAINGLTISLAAELSPNHIRVNAVAPSLTDTPLAKNLLSSDEKREASAKRHPLGKFGTPDDLAAAAIFLLSGDSSWITGQILGVDGGLSSIKPI